MVLNNINKLIFRRVREMKVSMTMLILLSFTLGFTNRFKEIPTWLNSIIVGIIVFIACCVIDFGY